MYPNRTLALAVALALSGAALADDAAPAHQEPGLEEVVVTANKRAAQSINDVAMSITAVTADDLQRRGIEGMEDYLSTLPSVSFVDVGYTSNNVIIRGLNTNPEGTTRPALVGMYFGETTLTGLIGLSNDSNPDVKLVDIERIELLPGPQGTLYGDASMGGALRVIPAKPRTDAFEAKLSGSYGFTEHTGDGNYDVQGVLNAPLVQDKLAVRFVGYRYNDEGYIKNIAGEVPDQVARATFFGATAPIEYVGGRKYTGGRVALRWDASEALSLTLSQLYQKYDSSGGPFNLRSLGKFKQSNFGGEGSGNHFGLTSLDLAYDMSWASLTSSTAWVEGNSTSASDLERGPGGGLPLFQVYDYGTTAFTEEARLASRLPGKLQWLVGAYYQDKRFVGAGGEDDWNFHVVWRGSAATDPFGGAELLLYTQNDRTKQNALFGEISYQLLEQLTATVGMRYYDYKKEDHVIASGFFAGGGSNTLIKNDDNGTTSRFNLAYKPTENALLFATYSEGFRLGGPHTLLPTTCDVDGDGLLDGPGIPFPTAVGSDETKNTELGTKLTLLDRRLQLNASVYSIDWSGIPVDIQLACGFPVTINAGKARSRGAELSGELALQHFRASYSASYTDAQLTRDAPPAGIDGDRLPGSPRLNGSLGLQYDFGIGGRDAFVRTDVAYVGKYYRDLRQTVPALGNYTTVSLRTGISFSNLDVELFARNLTNKYAQTWYDISRDGGTVLRPRTIGVELRYDFSNR